MWISSWWKRCRKLWPKKFKICSKAWINWSKKRHPVAIMMMKTKRKLLPKKLYITRLKPRKVNLKLKLFRREKVHCLKWKFLIGLNHKWINNWAVSLTLIIIIAQQAKETITKVKRSCLLMLAKVRTLQPKKNKRNTRSSSAFLTEKIDKEPSDKSSFYIPRATITTQNMKLCAGLIVTLWYLPRGACRRFWKGYKRDHWIRIWNSWEKYFSWSKWGKECWPDLGPS